MLSITFPGTLKEREFQQTLYMAIVLDDVVLFKSMFNIYDCQYDCFYHSVMLGSIEIAKYLLSIKYPLSENICYITISIRSCNILMLKYLHEEGFSWNTNTFTEAASLGNIKMLRYLYDNGCPFNSDAYYEAIHSNRYNIVVFLRQLNIPWERGILDRALSVGNIHIIKYILDNDYFVTDEEIPEYASGELLEYLKLKGLK